MGDVLSKIQEYKGRKKPTFEEMQDGNVRDMWQPDDPAAHFNHNVEPYNPDDPERIAAADKYAKEQRDALAVDALPGFKDSRRLRAEASSKDSHATPEQMSDYEAWQPIVYPPNPNYEPPKPKKDPPKKAPPPKASGGGGSVAAGAPKLDPEMVHDVALRGENGMLPDHEQMAYEQAKKAIESKKVGYNLKPLAALLDSWYGGNLAQAAPDVTTKEEKTDALANLAMKVAARKTELQSKEQERVDRLKVQMQKAGSEAQKEKLQHKLDKLELQLLEARVKAARDGGGKKHGKSPEDLAFQSYLTQNKKDIQYASNDKKMDPFAFTTEVKKLGDKWMEMTPGLSPSEAYARAHREFKTRHGDVQSDDGGVNVALADNAIAKVKNAVFPGR